MCVCGYKRKQKLCRHFGVSSVFGFLVYTHDIIKTNIKYMEKSGRYVFQFAFLSMCITYKVLKVSLTIERRAKRRVYKCLYIVLIVNIFHISHVLFHFHFRFFSFLLLASFPLLFFNLFFLLVLLAVVVVKNHPPSKTVKKLIRKFAF